MAKKILIIEDNAGFRESTAELLRAKGFEVLESPDGKDGLSKARKESPDLILLDVMMTSRTEGLDTAKKLQNDPATRAIPVVMLTGIRKEMNLPFGLEADEQWLPVKAVLEKPVKPDILLAAIREALGG